MDHCDRKTGHNKCERCIDQVVRPTIPIDQKTQDLDGAPGNGDIDCYGTEDAALAQFREKLTESSSWRFPWICRVRLVCHRSGPVGLLSMVLRIAHTLLE